MKVPYHTILPKNAKPQNNENGSTFHVTWALRLFVSFTERHRPLKVRYWLVQVEFIRICRPANSHIIQLLERTLADIIFFENPSDEEEDVVVVLQQQHHHHHVAVVVVAIAVFRTIYR